MREEKARRERRRRTLRDLAIVAVLILGCALANYVYFVLPQRLADQSTRQTAPADVTERITVARAAQVRLDALPPQTAGALASQSLAPEARQAEERAATAGDAPHIAAGSGWLAVDADTSSAALDLAGVDGRQAARAARASGDLAPLGLCASPAFVTEEAGNAITFSTRAGSVVAGPLPVAALFAEPAGAPLRAVRCFYDRIGVTWYSVASTVDPDGRHSHLDLAVSPGLDPTIAWAVYRIDTTDGGRAGCPCRLDDPRLGGDLYGIYVTGGEVGIGVTEAEPVPARAHLYAIDKASLGNREASAFAVHFAGVRAGPLAAETLQPVTSVTTTPAQFFVSALTGGGDGGNSLGVWALSDSVKLDQRDLPVLSGTTAPTESYSRPPLAEQGAGQPPLQTGDSRLRSATFAGGTVWAALDTVVAPEGAGKNAAGIAWFALAPQLSRGKLSSLGVSGQGYLGSRDASLVLGALAVADGGAGAVAATVVGGGYEPSAGYISFRADAQRPGFSAVHLAARGSQSAAGPACAAANGGACASAATAATDDDAGALWLAAAYQRYAGDDGWGTRVMRVGG